MNASRRDFMARFGSCTLLSATTLGLSARPARAFEAGLEQRIADLFSSDIEFDRNGKPVFRIGMAERLQHVEIRCPAGLVLAPAGIDGPQLEGTRHWRVHARNTVAAELRYAVELEAPSLRANVGDRRRHWASRLGEAEIAEFGAVFGGRGRVIDTRRTIIVGPAHRSLEQTRARAEAWVRKHGIHGRVIPKVLSHPQGELVAHDSQRGTTMATRGALWFRAQRNAAIEVTMRGSDRREHELKLRGDVCLTLDASGQLCVVNRIGERDLLAGLVPSEMYAAAGREALIAQAIAARGQILAKVGLRHLDAPYHLCASTHCQVYRGTRHEDPRVDIAVEASLGLVLMRPTRPSLVDTVYSANSGGHTANNETVWPGQPDPQLRGRPDPRLPAHFDAGISGPLLEQFIRSRPPAFAHPSRARRSHTFRWDVEVEAKSLRLPDRLKAIGSLRTIQIAERGPSGRIVKILLGGQHGRGELRGDGPIRRFFGGLRSTLFTLHHRGDLRFQIHGAGYGHGVGMCQTGAMGMAEAGHDHRQILAHYFRDGRLERFW